MINTDGNNTFLNVATTNSTVHDIGCNDAPFTDYFNALATNHGLSWTQNGSYYGFRFNDTREYFTRALSINNTGIFPDSSCRFSAGFSTAAGGNAVRVNGTIEDLGTTNNSFNVGGGITRNANDWLYGVANSKSIMIVEFTGANRSTLRCITSFGILRVPESKFKGHDFLRLFYGLVRLDTSYINGAMLRNQIEKAAGTGGVGEKTSTDDSVLFANFINCETSTPNADTTDFLWIDNTSPNACHGKIHHIILSNQNLTVGQLYSANVAGYGANVKWCCLGKVGNYGTPGTNKTALFPVCT